MALNKAKANLDKDPMHYLNIVAGNDKHVDKNDQMRPVSDKPDVFNGLKKADLREAKTMLKEGKMDDLAEKLGIDVGRLQAAADRLREMEREDAAKTAGKVNAMKAIIDELRENKDVIIFIDEIHTVVGTGNSSGNLDAANIFKPRIPLKSTPIKTGIKPDKESRNQSVEVIIRIQGNVYGLIISIKLNNRRKPQRDINI